MRKAILLAAIAGTAFASTASAQSLTTLFNANNAGSAGGGAYFAITVGANDVSITGFETNVNSGAGEPVEFTVYTHADGYDGFEQDPTGWTLQATGVGTAAGIQNPTVLAMDGSFTLLANTTYGMAVSLSATGPGGHAYTNGTGPNQNYADANISLELGAGNNALFAAGRFFPRVWNGTIHYEVVPAPASLALLGLGGLVAIRRRR